MFAILNSVLGWNVI